MINAVALDFDDVILATADTSAENVIQTLVWYNAEKGFYVKVVEVK